MQNSEWQKNPSLAAGLSLIPGLGQFYVRRFKKGVALLCIDAGLVFTLAFFHSRLSYFLCAVIYVAAAVPAAVEAYSIAQTGYGDLKLNPKAYVIAMLLITGCSALPLLWQDVRFSRASKIFWTLTVVLLAVMFLGSLAIWGAQLEKILDKI